MDDYNNPTTGVSTFLQKLLAMVEDHTCDHLISWSPDGNSFRVHDPVTFAKEVLPKFFKHNNFSSFVRQLNMYDFHKVLDVQQGALATGPQEWEFANAKFKRGQLALLSQVKRKAGTTDTAKPKSESLKRVLQDMQMMQEQQSVIQEKLEHLDSDNKNIWGEMSKLKSRHQLQQQTINRILYFLTSIYAPDRLVGKDKSRLMLQGDDDTVTIDPSGYRPGQPGDDVSILGPSTQMFPSGQPQQTKPNDGFNFGALAMPDLMGGGPGQNNPPPSGGPQNLDFFSNQPPSKQTGGATITDINDNDLMNSYISGPGADSYTLDMGFPSTNTGPTQRGSATSDYMYGFPGAGGGPAQGGQGGGLSFGNPGQYGAPSNAYRGNFTGPSSFQGGSKKD
eukprot:comp21574_c0_seq1/m.30145 comp21574_c0_seq1/g.30145  ORF comp21574_c0_seq1/g.30145 comp21574_c0_seq1/m.30145 type:complete len:392 (-) comp21574_c0_seq1:192-1367(-)